MRCPDCDLPMLDGRCAWCAREEAGGWLTWDVKTLGDFLYWWFEDPTAVPSQARHRENTRQAHLLQLKASGMTCPEIAVREGMKVGAVRLAIHRERERLRRAAA